MPPGSYVFQPTGTIFELVQDIIRTNVPTKFHEDNEFDFYSVNKFYYSHNRKTAPPPGGHVFQPTGTIFELIQDNIGTNLLTKFYEDRK